jgi:hypothetical protein
VAVILEHAAVQVTDNHQCLLETDKPTVDLRFPPPDHDLELQRVLLAAV